MTRDLSIWNSLKPFSIGFNSLFDDFDRMLDSSEFVSNYPPYNIIDESETESIIEMAVAGFNEEDLDIEQDGNKLTISGNKDVKPDDSKYRHQGIAYRNFSRTFALADHIQVNGASVDAGILRVYLERIVPDELKAKKINIVSDRVLLTETSSKKSKKK